MAILKRESKKDVVYKIIEEKMVFLTLEDPNTKINGSRDPLGMQSVWVSFARHLISNLTIKNTSVIGFTICILSRYFANLLVEDTTFGLNTLIRGGTSSLPFYL